MSTTKRKRTKRWPPFDPFAITSTTGSHDRPKVRIKVKDARGVSVVRVEGRGITFEDAWLNAVEQVPERFRRSEP